MGAWLVSSGGIDRDVLALLVDAVRRLEGLEAEVEARGKKFGSLAATLRRDLRQMSSDLSSLRAWALGDPLAGKPGAASTIERLQRRLAGVEESLKQLSEGEDAVAVSQLEDLERDLRAEISGLVERLEDAPVTVEAKIPEQAIEIDIEAARWKRDEITKTMEFVRSVAKPALSLVLLALAFWVAARLGVLGDVLQAWAEHPLGGSG